MLGVAFTLATYTLMLVTTPLFAPMVNLDPFISLESPLSVDVPTVVLPRVSACAWEITEETPNKKITIVINKALRKKADNNFFINPIFSIHYILYV